MHPARVAIISIVAMVIALAAALVGVKDCTADETVRTEEAVAGHAPVRAVASLCAPDDRTDPGGDRRRCA